MSYLNPNEAARRLGVDRATVIKWIRQGHLPAYKTPGGQYRIHADDLLLALRPARERGPK